MSQAKGTPALTELDGGGPAMPSWGRRASGSCQLLHRNSGSPGRADPARCPPQGCLCLLDIRCPESQRWSGGTSAPPCLAGCPPEPPVPDVPRSPGASSPPQHWGLPSPLGSSPGAVDGCRDPTLVLSRGVQWVSLRWVRRTSVLCILGAQPGLLPWGFQHPTSSSQSPGPPQSPWPGAAAGVLVLQRGSRGCRRDPGAAASPCQRVAAAWRGCIARAPRVP